LARDRWIRLAAIFLALSYGIGAPFAGFLEYRSHVISRHFGYPPWFIYAVGVFEFVCAVGVLIRPLAPWAAGGLTVMTVGAMGSHLRIGTPMRAVPALLFTVVQTWFALASRKPRTSP